jgi:MFS family permease
MGLALARAVRSPQLWAWLAAAAACTLLDELVIALAALRLQREQGLSEVVAAATTVAFSAGSVVGATLTDAAVARYGSRRVLVGSAALCLASLAVVVAPHAATASAGALFVLGLACAPHHPLAMARAYDAMPENLGTVQALGQLFVVVDIGAPLALGVVADRFGLRGAMACLALQPILVFVLATCLRPRTPTPASPRVS